MQREKNSLRATRVSKGKTRKNPKQNPQKNQNKTHKKTPPQAKQTNCCGKKEIKKWQSVLQEQYITVRERKGRTAAWDSEAPSASTAAQSLHPG